MIKKFSLVLFLIVFIFSFLVIYEVNAQAGGLLDISVGTESSTGPGLKISNDNVFYFNMIAGEGSVVISSITFTEASLASTAIDYRLYYFDNSAYELLASGGSPIDGAIVFSNLNYSLNANSVTKFKVVANTLDTISVYRLDITNVSLSQGQLITPLPFEGTIRWYDEEQTQIELAPNLEVSLSGNSPDGARERSSFQELIRVDLSSPDEALTITSLTFAEVYSQVTAKNYRLYVGDNLIASGIEPYNNRIILTDLNISVSPGNDKMIKMVGDTTNTYTNFQLKLTNIATKETSDIEELPVYGNTLTFSIHLEGSVQGLPHDTIERSSSEHLMRFNIKPVGSDVTLDNIRLTYDANSGVTDFKLYDATNDSVPIGTVEYNGNMISFVNLNFPLQNNLGDTFDIRANTTNAVAGNFQLRSLIPSTIPISEVLTHGFPLDSNPLYFLAQPGTATTPSLNVSLNSGSASSTQIKSAKTPLLKFNLTASGEDVIVNGFSFEQQPAAINFSDYQLWNLTDNIVLAEKVQPFSNTISMSGSFDILIPNGETKTLELYANSQNVSSDSTPNIKLNDIFTFSQANISGLPLTGRLLNFLSSSDNQNQSEVITALASDTPSGNSVPNVNDELIRIWITANNSAAIINGLVFSENMTNSGITNYRISEVGSANVLAQGSWVNNSLVFQNFNLGISEGATKKLKVIANTSNITGNSSLELTEIQTVGYVRFMGLPVKGNTIIFTEAGSVPPTNNQDLSDKEKEYRERIRQLEYKVSALESQVINLEKQLYLNTDQNMLNRTKGRILLQVEENGEAWYVDPEVGKKFYLKDGASAYIALNAFGLGISNEDLMKIPVGVEERFQLQDTDGDGLADQLEEAIGTDLRNPDTDGDGFIDSDELKTNYSPLNRDPEKESIDQSMINRLSGKILLQVQDKGQAWYINPEDGKRYYLQDGDFAYQIMRFLSLGITNNDLRKIPVGELL